MKAAAGGKETFFQAGDRVEIEIVNGFAFFTHGI
jgi:hypothetical protein